MEKTKKIGMFDVSIDTLPEVKRVSDILASNEKIEDHFTKVKCVMRKRSFKMKDGTYSDPSYSLIVSFNESIEETLVNKSLINKNEFVLLQMHFLKPLDTNEIRFDGWVRFLRGESDKLIGDDKTYTLIELFIDEDLSSINSILSNGTKLVLNRFSSLSDDELRVMKAKELSNFKIFKLSNSSGFEELNSKEAE